MATKIRAAFVAGGDRGAVDDFGMAPQELQSVLKALKGTGINVVAIQILTEDESPLILFPRDCDGESTVAIDGAPDATAHS